MSTDPRERWEVTFSGHVQGVGFRYRTERLARGYAVAGYVRNLPDGRVELVAEGARGDLEALLAALDQAMSGYIRDRQVRECPPTGEFSGFGIRH